MDDIYDDDSESEDVRVLCLRVPARLRVRFRSIGAVRDMTNVEVLEWGVRLMEREAFGGASSIRVSDQQHGGRGA